MTTPNAKPHTDKISRKIEALSDKYPRLATLLRFSSSSLLAAGLDYATFTLLIALLRNSAVGPYILISTIGGRVISFIVNFTVNRKKVFHQETFSASMLLRYFSVTIGHVLVSSLLISLLHSALGQAVPESIIKIPVDASLFFVNYFIQKKWVFPERKAKTGGIRPDEALR